MDEEERTRVLIALGQPEDRLALRIYLQAQRGLEVVGEAARGRDLLEQLGALCPDLVLLEWDLPDRPSANLLADLRNLNCQPLVVVYGNHPESSSAATDAGADAFVFKGEGPKRVTSTINWVVLEARYAQPPDRHDL